MRDRFRSDSERLIDSVGEVLEAARVERPVNRPAREPEGQQARDRAPGQDKPEALKGIEAGPSAPASHRVPLKGVIANLKRPRRFLVRMGMGVVVVVCLLGFGLFKATRPQPVSVGRSSSPTPAPLAAASNSPSPALLASQALPRQAASSVDWLAEAKRYLDAKDYLNALPPLEKAADAGNADAMTNLGYLYENGFGVTQDHAQSRRWFQQAADAGDTGAMKNLGSLYVNGHGVTQDYQKAREWYQKAADGGNTDAKQALASRGSK